MSVSPLLHRCIPLLACLPLLAACEASLDVDLTDGPIDGAESVVLQVTGIKLLKEDGSTVTIDAEVEVDLLQYRNGSTLRLADGVKVPTARYTGAYLTFADEGSYVGRSDGSQVPVVPPASQEFTGLDLDVGEEDEAGLLLDLELRFSLDDNVDSLGSYALNPVLRAMDPDQVGEVSGKVANALVEDSDCRQGRSILRGVGVYAYAGNGVTPVDYARDRSSGTQPVSAAAVYDDGDGGYRYRFAYLPEGDYTLALTCKADDERPATSDDLDFSHRRNATVTEGEIRSIAFTDD
ncbi:DUF4382 domain-containing protein [Solimonas sp. K1W22B-7]|uniref:DUF4382 domain-containing protein n=1 Tax=Solimonas sp. K1W22B-7 TaxID=2303331 RepID=UPI000E334FA4|nr:DUF4382 domain-containing protein [Solimonas sp. K1W22B-7]AXQ29950.1 DUF4382 domain-containing protein [Solimonas sp. K1W22B-7]